MAACAVLTVVTAVAAVAPGTAGAQPNRSGDVFSIIPLPAGASFTASTQGAYDHERDRFLVVAVAMPQSQQPASLVSQLVGPDGAAIAGGGARRNVVQALHPQPSSPTYWRNQFDVAFNPVTDEYLVAWAQSTGPANQVGAGARSSAVFAQRYSAITGQLIGSPTQLNTVRGTSGSCSVFDPELEFNPATGGYLGVWRYGFINGAGGDPACPGLPAGEPMELELVRLTSAGAVDGAPAEVTGSGSATEDGFPELVRHPTSGEFLLAYRYSRPSPLSQTNVLQRVSSAGQLIGGPVTTDPELQRGSAYAAVRPDGNWLVTGYIIGDNVKAYVFSPTLARIGPRVDVVGPQGVTELTALGDGTFLLRDQERGALAQVGPTGATMGSVLLPGNGNTALVGRPGAPVLVAGVAAVPAPLYEVVGMLVTFGPGPTITTGGILRAGNRRCVDVAGVPGDAALVNLTPVGALGGGNGQLVSSDVADPPVASNVNFNVGSVDPNVAVAPIGADGNVCFVNSPNTSVHVIADHLASVDSSVVTLATPSGAPDRKVDTRIGQGGTLIGPGGRVCFLVAGSPGDAALVNLTPIGALGGGNGQLVSSDVVDPPVASNVNFNVGSVDPNVAVAPIGADGKVCFVNSPNTSVHLIADHLATIDAAVVTLATASGAPDRKVDTRIGVGGSLVGPSGRVCFTVAGAAGDVALVNLTPVEAQGPGNAQLLSSDVVTPPLASNVNFNVGTVDPNVAVAPIGANGQVCFVNSPNAAVQIIADHLATIDAAVVTLATPSGASSRRMDTRG